MRMATLHAAPPPLWLLVMGMVLFAGPAGNALAADATPKSIIYVEETMPTSMNPLFPANGVDRRAHQLVFDYLYERSVVAEGYRSRVVEMLSAEPEGQTYTLTLKKGLRWHDKHPISSTDICFSIRALQHQDTPTSWPVPASIRACEAPEPLTVRLTFEEPVIEVPAHLNFPLLPSHVFDGPAITRDNSFAAVPVGSGPMQAALDERNRWQMTAHKSPHVAPKSSS